MRGPGFHVENRNRESERSLSGESGALKERNIAIEVFGRAPQFAGRFLTDSDQPGAIVSKLPAGWENNNLQLVLHARIIGNTPALPEVVASHVW